MLFPEIRRKAGEGSTALILKYLVFLREINFSYQLKGEDRIRFFKALKEFS